MSVWWLIYSGLDLVGSLLFVDVGSLVEAVLSVCVALVESPQ